MGSCNKMPQVLQSQSREKTYGCGTYGPITNGTLRVGAPVLGVCPAVRAPRPAAAMERIRRHLVDYSPDRQGQRLMRCISKSLVDLGRAEELYDFPSPHVTFTIGAFIPISESMVMKPAVRPDPHSPAFGTMHAPLAHSLENAGTHRGSHRWRTTVVLRQGRTTGAPGKQ